MIVPSTPTATDKLEEVRKLNVEIAGLTRAKDTAERAFIDAKGAVDDALERKGALDAAIDRFEANLTGVAVEMREFVAQCRKTLNEVIETMESAANQTKAISVKMNEMIEEIRKLELNRQALLDSIARENELISQQRADLDIYHRRILAAADIHLPGQKIII